MQANIGTTDRIIRIVAGLLLLSLIFIGPKTLWGLVGLVPLATAFINFCPAYKLLGVDTLGR
ncbi:YgaP family membrane protein [Methylocystis sp.]|uniref:YgaP family membrane protein n=1 Tax=Methylocystis sp. TaxID=1911079 RepID=UPI003D103D47